MLVLVHLKTGLSAVVDRLNAQLTLTPGDSRLARRYYMGGDSRSCYHGFPLRGLVASRELIHTPHRHGPPAPRATRIVQPYVSPYYHHVSDNAGW